MLTNADIAAKHADDQVYVTISGIAGKLAEFAVVQSPYRMPEGLTEAVKALTNRLLASDLFEQMPGSRTHWAEMSYRTLAFIINEESLMAIPEIAAWNESRDHRRTYGAVEYNPHQDFIDVSALARNVVFGVIRDALRDQHVMERELAKATNARHG